MSTVFIVIGAFTLAFIFLMGLAIFFIKPDHNTESEDQHDRETTIDKDGIKWGHGRW